MLDMDATLSARTNIWDLLGASAMQIFAYSGGIRWQNTSIDFMGFPFVIWIILYDSVSRGGALRIAPPLFLHLHLITGKPGFSLTILSQICTIL